MHEAPSRAAGEGKCIFVNIEFILYHITSNTILLTPALNVQYFISFIQIHFLIKFTYLFQKPKTTFIYLSFFLLSFIFSNLLL